MTSGGLGVLIVTLALLVVRVLVKAEDAGFPVLILGGADVDEGYTPLVPALKSVVQLAAEHVAEAGSPSQFDDISLTVVETADGAPAAASLCTTIGANDSATYGVSVKPPFSCLYFKQNN